MPRSQPAVLPLDPQAISRLRDALHSREQVSGFTHTFYRYPARFSPRFASAVIEALTKPGDLVVDPFMGGGTTIIEAMAAGRLALGCDVNPLATFLASVKTSPLTGQEAKKILHWRHRFDRTLNLRNRLSIVQEWLGYDQHVPWWLRKTIQHGLNTSDKLATRRQRMFARCSLARTAQWALDCRSHVPSSDEFLAKHEEHVSEMLAGDNALRERLTSIHQHGWRNAIRRQTRLLLRSAAGLECDGRFPKSWSAPRLILTSPPYVGVHMLYHRWQVRGRRETSAPYWIIGKHNGYGESYFTFGDRRRGFESYLPTMLECYASIRALMSKHTVLVQLVAFSEPKEQLPEFLAVLGRIGFTQIEQIGSGGLNERRVPNRKWYADARGHSGASQEYLLVHRKTA
jgi:hypothetical protein